MSGTLVPGGPVLGAEVAFDVVFGAFVVAFVVLAVVTLRWAVRRDRAGRAQWARRRAAPADPGTATNGTHPKRPGDRPGAPG